MKRSVEPASIRAIWPLPAACALLLLGIASARAQNAPTITQQPASQSIPVGGSAAINVAVSGAGPFTYQWQFNGASLPNDIITTVAGNGTGSYSGDGGPATNAGLWNPSDMAFDAAGNLYIADSADNLIRKVDTNGIITTVAGDGTGGFSGDGGLATNASLYLPTGVAADAFANLFIADFWNNRIRKVNTNGIISTAASDGSLSYSGTPGYSGDGGPATNASLYNPIDVAVDASGNLYLADYGNQRIRMVDTNGIITTVAGNGNFGYSGDGGPATNASLNYPQGVAFDTLGNLYIADSQNNRIRKANTNGIISTAAGDGSPGYSGDGEPAGEAQLHGPGGVATDASGNVFIADTYNLRIRKVDTNGIVTTVAGNGAESYSGDGGPAISTSLNYPAAVAVDSSGNLFIADEYNNRIREVHFAESPTLSITSVSANNAGSYSVIVSSPYGAVTSTVVTLTVLFPPVISTQPFSQFVPVGSNASFTLTAGGTLPLSYQWYCNDTAIAGATNSTYTTNQVSADAGGSQFTCVVTNVAASITSAVATLTVAPSGALIPQPASQIAIAGTNVTFAVAVSGPGPFTYQWLFYGSNLLDYLITTVAGNGNFGYSGDGHPATNANLYQPRGVAVDASGILFIADYANNRIRKVPPNGIITTVSGNGYATYSGDGGQATNAGLHNPAGVAVDPSGNLFIADEYNNRIRKVTPNGIITTVAGNGSATYSGDDGPATNATLYNPTGVTVDAFGNLFIADFNNFRIRKVDTNGIITTLAGNGTIGYSGDGGPATNASFYNPDGVAVDSSGKLFIADNGNNRIRKVAPNGIITTVVGNGVPGYAGDGGTATNAELHYPAGVAVDASGNLFIADANNNRIRKVDVNGIITTVAGNGAESYSGDGGPATNASLSLPAGVAVGVAVDLFGNLFIADANNQRIRQVTPLGAAATLLLNNLTTNNAGYYQVIVTGPYGAVTSTVATLTVIAPPFITSQPAGQLVYVGSNASFTLTAGGTLPLSYQWYCNDAAIAGATNSTYTTNQVSADAGGSQFTCVVTNVAASITSAVATLALALPPAIASQPTNQTVLLGSNLVFAVPVSGASPLSYQWQFNGVNLPDYIISTVAGNGTGGYSGDAGSATNAMLNGPYGVAVNASGNVLIADEYNNRIRKVTASGIIATVAGNGAGAYSGDGGQATNAGLHNPAGVALDASGNLFIADAANYRIRKVDTNGIITTVAGNGTSGYSNDGGVATSARLAYPTAVALDASGNLFIADYLGNRVRKVDINGIITTAAGNGTQGYAGDGGPATSGSLYYPAGVAVDSSGNLFIADQQNWRIRKVDLNGIITTVVGIAHPGFSGDGGQASNASLGNPTGIVLDTSGNLFIADSANQRIRKVAINGVITTVAGNGVAGSSGDAGPATNASLHYPDGVAVDAFGNLFIADDNDQRIRQVALAGAAPTLLLNNLTTNNTGNYQLIVTNLFGSVTSTVAALTVVLPPQNLAATLSADQCVHFQLNGTPGYSYVLLMATNLTPPVNWQPLATNCADTNSNCAFTDANTAANPARFYRVGLFFQPAGATNN